MEYRQHPLIEGLKLNEDGSQIVYKGCLLTVRIYRPKNRNVSILKVYLANKNFTVAKLICECWNGLRPSRKYCIKKRNQQAGLHYSNLYWEIIGAGNLLTGSLRDKFSKVKTEDLPIVISRIKKGHRLMDIAKDYNTSKMSISRINQKFVTPFLKDNEGK